MIARPNGHYDAAVDQRIPCFTSLDTARSAVDSLLHGDRSFTIQPLREYLGP